MRFFASSFFSPTNLIWVGELGTKKKIHFFKFLGPLGTILSPLAYAEHTLKEIFDSELGKKKKKNLVAFEPIC